MAWNLRGLSLSHADRGLTVGLGTMWRAPGDKVYNTEQYWAFSLGGKPLNIFEDEHWSETCKFHTNDYKTFLLKNKTAGILLMKATICLVIFQSFLYVSCMLYICWETCKLRYSCMLIQNLKILLKPNNLSNILLICVNSYYKQIRQCTICHHFPGNGFINLQLSQYTCKIPSCKW